MPGAESGEIFIRDDDNEDESPDPNADSVGIGRAGDWRIGRSRSDSTEAVAHEREKLDKWMRESVGAPSMWTCASKTVKLVEVPNCPSLINQDFILLYNEIKKKVYYPKNILSFLSLAK
ncbi:hypothetical protein PanWU01x14_136730, partial [Parasponia andersonii]